MRRDALRTLLVLSERPHPWAFLRDRLDPGLIRVAWARPADSGPAIVEALPALWMLAGTGTGRPAGLDPLRGRVVACRWVGPAPGGLLAPVATHEDWRSLAAAVAGALRSRLGGVRLAPGRGLVLADGSFLPPAPELEALFATQPEGLPVAGDHNGRATRRRLTAQLQRCRLPLRLAHRDGRLCLEPLPAVGSRAAPTASDGRAP